MPKDVPLISFSMLLARQKGDLKAMLEGLEAVKGLKDGSKILMAEACTHSSTHESSGVGRFPSSGSTQGRICYLIFTQGTIFLRI